MTTNEILKEILPKILRGINRQSVNQYPEVLTGESESSKNNFYYIVKGAGSGAVVTSIKTFSGVDYPSSVLNFINNEVANGTYFYIPFSQISISSGSLVAGRSDFK